MSDEETSGEYFDASSQSRAIAPKKPPKRKPTTDDIERWTRESGMRQHAMADALGDEDTVYESQDESADDDAQNAQAMDVTEADLEKAEAEDKGIRGSVY
jgi:hypothetical protein